MLAEERWKKASEISAEKQGLADSLGLLQRRKRWTACDDWRLSVEKEREKERGRKKEREKESTWVT